jgi:hypothetical protein
MHPNRTPAATGPLHWHTNAVALDGGSVETRHATFFEALAAARRLACEARPATGRVRWFVDDPNGRGPVSYYVYGADGRLAVWVMVSPPCTLAHDFPQAHTVTVAATLAAQDAVLAGQPEALVALRVGGGHADAA